MPKKLPRITGEQAISAFRKAGFEHERTKGSHWILKRAGHRHHLSVPVHKGKTLGPGLLKALIASSGITEERFLEYLDQ